LNFFFKDFIYLFDTEREILRESTSRGKGRGRRRSRLPTEQGLRSQDTRIVT